MKGKSGRFREFSEYPVFNGNLTTLAKMHRNINYGVDDRFNEVTFRDDFQNISFINGFDLHL